MDTLRADRLRAYGAATSLTPNMDGLAARGSVFAVAYAPMGTTTPSHATIFTGRSPLSHGVIRNGMTLPPDATTLAELLKAAGYATAAFVSAYPVSHRFGLAQGFGVFDDSFEPRTSTLPVQNWEGLDVEGAFDRVGEATDDADTKWWTARDRTQPTFAWVHLFDPHYPYGRPSDSQPANPGPGVERTMYDEGVQYADEQVGRLLASLDAEPVAPAVVLVADHGEGLMDHGWQEHNRFLYEEEVRVPWIVTWPGHVRVQRIFTQSSLADVTPTIAALVGAPRPADPFEGRDRSPVLLGDSTALANEPVFLLRPYYSGGIPLVPTERGWGWAVVASGWKYIEAPQDGRRELYDLAADQHEKHNRVESEPDRAAAMQQAVQSWFHSRVRSVPLSDDSPPDVVEGLRALGYLE